MSSDERHHRELFDELAGKGFTVGPGDIGENVVTSGVELPAPPQHPLEHG